MKNGKVDHKQLENIKKQQKGKVGEPSALPICFSSRSRSTLLPFFSPTASTPGSIRPSSSSYLGAFTTHYLCCNMNTFFTKKASVIMVGNPGSGKSAILNALGGDFPSGFSDLQGMTTRVSYKDVKFNDRSFRLVDTPGISDPGDGGQGDERTNTRLKMLQEAMNDGLVCAIFFVISPRNGRIEPGTLALMQLVLESMKKGPKVGLIINQVMPGHMDQVQSEDYIAAVRKVLEENKADLSFLDKQAHLVLVDHDEGFSEQDRYDIKQYILRFKPKEVLIRDMLAKSLRFILMLLMVILQQAH